MADEPFEYLLCVLTHGDPADLRVTLASFEEHVTPQPTRRVMVVDGPEPPDGEAVVHTPEVALSDTDWTGGPHGFCRATRLLWTIARNELCPWVFWLEHDFVFNQSVDLERLAVPLAQHDVAQMALMRGPVSLPEQKAGGLFESRRNEFTVEDGGWLSHRSYFTTNPSLMRREFMHENPWPRHASECEGKFGIELVGRGYRFGVWGDGRRWVEHIGSRTGSGY